MTTTEWRKPFPTPSPLTQPFWDGTKRGELLVQRCPECGHNVWTPQLACNRCLNESLQWTRVSGRGTIYSFTVMHRAATPAFTSPSRKRWN